MTTGSRASDPEFKQLVFDQRVGQTPFSTPLEPGQFYWRVSGVRGGVEGIRSSARHFRVRRSLGGPPLHVALPPSVVRVDRYVVAGTTQPGATVLAAGQRDTADDRGGFAFEVALKPGVNVVVVEAIDELGNSSYASAIVNAKFEGR